MTSRAAAALSVAALAVVAIAVACEPERPACYRGDYRECNCPNLALGYQGCLPSQNGWYACVCEPVPPAAPLAFGTGAFLSTCAKGSDCAGGYCSLGRCTMPCSTDSDCPPLPPPLDGGDLGGDAGDDAGDGGALPACAASGLCRTVN